MNSSPSLSSSAYREHSSRLRSLRRLPARSTPPASSSSALPPRASLSSRFISRLRRSWGWWLRAMLCGTLLYFGISLTAAEYLIGRAAKESNYEKAMVKVLVARALYPFDHRFREYPVIFIRAFGRT